MSLKLPDLVLDCSGPEDYVAIGGKTLSLKALAALTPAMLSVLEQLVKPEANGGVFRVERKGDQVRLMAVGIMGHVVHKTKLRHSGINREARR